MIALWKSSEWLLTDSEIWLPNSAEALQFGMGLFETLHYKNETIEYLEAHVRRLSNSCAALKIEFAVTSEDILEGFTTLLRQEQVLSDALALKISVFKNGLKSQVLLSFRPHPYTDDTFSQGLVLGFYGIGRLSHSRLVGHKTTNYFENILLREEALNQGCFDGIFLNEQGMITEGAAVNVFFESKGSLYTPAVENGLLPGIMRQSIIEKAKKHGVRVIEGNFTLENLTAADRIYVTNSLIGIQAVRQLMEKTYSVESTAIGKCLTS